MIKIRNIFRWKKDGKSILLFAMRSYILVLLIPFVLSVAFYAFSVNQAHNNAVYANNRILHSASKSLDLRLQEVENIASEIVNNSAVRLFQNKSASFQYPHSYKMIQTRDSLSSYELTQSFISNYYIAFNRSRIVMNRLIIYTYDDFFRDYIEIPGIPPDSLHDKTLNGELKTGLLSVRDISILGTTGRYLSVIHPLYGSKQGSVGYVVILIDETDVTGLFSDINIGDTGAIYVVDNNGEVLMNITGEDTHLEELYGQTAIKALDDDRESSFYIRTGQGEMLVNTLATDANDLTYVSIQPTYLILSHVRTVRNIMVICLCIALIGGVFLSFRQARRFSTPVTSILHEIDVDPEDPDEAFQLIRELIVKLRSNNEHLDELAAEHKALLRSSFLSRLFNGNVNSEIEARRVCQHIFPDHVYFSRARVLLSRILIGESKVHMELLASIKVALKDAFERHLSQPLYYDIDEETLALLIFDEEKEAINALFSAIFEGLPDRVRESVYVSGGGEVSMLTHIVRSYEQAHTSMAMRQFMPEVTRGIDWLDGSPGAVQYFYPVDMRRQLTEAVCRGDNENVEGILDELFLINFGERPIPEPIRRVFISDLLSTAIQCISILLTEDAMQHSFIDRFDPIYRSSSRKQPALLRELFLDLTELSNRHKNEASDLLIGRVVEYLRAHFRESDLSLASVADHFSVNPPVLSSTFKQYTGKNLSSHLEDLRIQEAQRLIRTTDLTINRIAEEVGYLSANTFCRAFRRNTGYNTSTYKAMTE